MVRDFKKRKLAEGKIVIARFGGNSMTPLVKSKQPVRLKPCNLKDLKVGDITYCRVAGNDYLHLVKATDPKRGVLIGNAHGRINGWTKEIIGIVDEVLPFSYRG